LRLAELIIENFRGIGNPVRVKIDEIVVLIGKNNVGKTTILKAYEAFVSAGSSLTEKDFYNENIDNKPTIIGIFNNVEEEFSEKWIHKDEELGYESCIKVKYVWEAPGQKGKKYSFDPEKGEYVPGGTGGMDSILANRLPTPIMISPLDNPEDLEKNILSILTEAIKENTKKDQAGIQELLNQIEEIAETVQEEIRDEIEESTKMVSQEIEKVFPELNHVEIEAKAAKFEPEKLIIAGSFIRVGNKSDEKYMTPLANHGTGLQRTFLWAALKMLAETGRHKIGRTTINTEKPKILLIEEPEAFLHPYAIKEARDSLYSIAKLPNWQVMVTTHSPIFIDLTKDHTTIIRIEKNEETNHSVKTFSTDQSNFTKDDRENIKMLNYCNPYFNEFFFAKQNLLVEGDTEYTVVKLILEKEDICKDLHVINCFGKANIVTVAKILNHFSVPYSIIHDSDRPKAKRKGKFIQNSAWTMNKRILDEVMKGREKQLNIKTFVSVPDFEGQFMNEIRGKAKPYEAWNYFQNIDNEKVKDFINLLKYLNLEIEYSPYEYLTEKDFLKKVEEYINYHGLETEPYWQLDEVEV